MTDERHNPEVIIKLAGGLLSRQFGREISLRPVKVFSTFKSVVVRVRVIRGAADLPGTLIVKKVREGSRGYDPNSPATTNAAHDLFNDWAAARFLHGLCNDPPLSPRFYAGCRTEGLIVLEDLEAFAELSEEQGQMRALGESAREVVKRLGELWPAEVCRLPAYPAFNIICQ
jgi:hypothetical protein